MPSKLTLTTLGQRIDQLLEDEIIEGRLRPGERLIAEELAERFGVSRIPIRESLRALDAAGWVEIRARHGVYVRRWSGEELGQLFDVRTVLESEAARLAAHRRTDEQLQKLQENLDQYEQAIARQDNAVPELNRQFHRLIAESAQNKVLEDYLDDIGKRVKWYFSSVTITRSPESAAEHRHLLTAIENRNVIQASKLMRAHVGRTRQAIALVLAGLELGPE